MKKLLLFIQKNHRKAYLLFVFSVSALIILYVYPGQIQFKYEFQKGKTWQHEDLVAPFRFSKKKSAALIEEEKKRLTETKALFFTRDNEVLTNILVELNANWSTLISDENLEYADSIKIREVIAFLFKRGVIEETQELKNGNASAYYLIVDNKVQKFLPEDYFNKAEVSKFLQNGLKNKKIVTNILKLIVPNIKYNHARTEMYLAQRLNKIIENSGVINQGELIILKGSLVDDEKYTILNSLKKAYEEDLKEESFPFQLIAGQLIYIILLLSVLYSFIYYFRRGLLNYIANINLVMFSVVAMVVLAIVVIKVNANWLLIVPFAIVPIIMRAFYDTRIALFVHLVTILLVGYYAPNGFEFIFIQFIAGMSAIINVGGLYKRSHLFIAALKIIGVYLLAFGAFILLEEKRFGDDQLIAAGYLVASGFFSLFAFPLIYIYEKIFGQVSDLTLLELADTNSPLLRELAHKAPGSFHHSVQVANLAENAALTIEANTLLVRTGALYHDIGKMLAPMYFVENQVTGVNPHDDLSFDESATIIISHVLDGVKLAKKNRLPDLIIDFIRTHHGTTRVEYFYRQYLKSFPDNEEAVKYFTYPGPLPFSKETAILMMADSVEAGTRSLKIKNAENINELIEKIINHQLAMGQFNNANITLKEIGEIKQVFKVQLANIYHARIEYPEKIK